MFSLRRARDGEERLWKIWWFLGIPLACVASALLIGAEALHEAGAHAWGSALDLARLALYWFWFRWAALATVITGLLLISMSPGALVRALSIQAPFQAIGVGMWLGLVMAFNVWFIIWPNQKKALGIVTVEADAKAKAARMAMLTSRFNTMLSIPMLYCMVAQQNGGL